MNEIINALRIRITEIEKKLHDSKAKLSLKQNIYRIFVDITYALQIDSTLVDEFIDVYTSWTKLSKEDC